MKLKIFFLFLILQVGTNVFAQQGFPFANEIRAFKHQDSISFPKPDCLLFIGSSSIRMWSDLETRFPGKPIIKRGVGGSQLWQLADYFTPYILFPYHPRKIFIYAGENDIAEGRSAAFVADEFKKLYMLIRSKLPIAEIDFMSIKLSPSRAKYFDEVNSANKMIGDYLKNKPHSHYLDMATVLFKPNTVQPDSSLFKSDYLHLNNAGYDRWQKVLEPYVN